MEYTFVFDTSSPVFKLLAFGIGGNENATKVSRYYRYMSNGCGFRFVYLHGVRILLR